MKRRPLMERVWKYVNCCHRHGWRAVFTFAQFREIMTHCEQHHWEMDLTRRTTIFGVEFIVDDTPRPPMPTPEELKKIQVDYVRRVYGPPRFTWEQAYSDLRSNTLLMTCTTTSSWASMAAVSSITKC